jgi:hypothetical protein
LYTAATRDERLATKYRDLSADRWDRWFFDHGEAGLIVGIGVACAAMASLGHWFVGGWIGIAVGVAVGLVASILHAFTLHGSPGCPAVAWSVALHEPWLRAPRPVSLGSCVSTFNW